MECAYHSGKQPVGTCHECGKFVCLECKTFLDGKIYCPRCRDQFFPVQEQISANPLPVLEKQEQETSTIEAQIAQVQPAVREQTIAQPAVNQQPVSIPPIVPHIEPPEPAEADITTHSNTTCPSCSKQIEPDDMFCAFCGHRLTIEIIENQSANQSTTSTITSKPEFPAGLSQKGAEPLHFTPSAKLTSRPTNLPAGFLTPLRLISLVVGVLMLVSIFFLAWLDFSGLTVGIFEFLGLLSMLFIAGAFTFIAVIFLKKRTLRGLLYVIIAIVELLLWVAVMFLIVNPMAQFAPSVFSLPGPGFWLFLAAVTAVLAIGLIEIFSRDGVKTDYAAQCT